MFNIWPYLLRLAVALYFIYPHAQALSLGVKKAKLALFECINQSVQIPEVISFTLWHSFFVVVGTSIIGISVVKVVSSIPLVGLVSVVILTANVLRTLTNLTVIRSVANSIQVLRIV
jgi:hypothetical protein